MDNTPADPVGVPTVPAQVNTAAPLALRTSKLVIVEGKDEELCFSHWLKQWSLSGIQVAPVGDKEQIAPTLGILRLLPGFD